MPLKSQVSIKLESMGNWLFRWRSYLPLLTVVLFVFFLQGFRYPFDSHAAEQAWEIFCLFISLFGLCIRIVTAGSIPRGTSGRNTKKQIATQLNTTGMYSIVRHPFYVGNLIIWLGLSLFLRSFWCAVANMILCYIYYRVIIIAEEIFLENSFGEQFKRWSQNTPMLFPHFRIWRSPLIQFSIKAAVKREYPTLFLLISSFYSLKIASSFFVENDFVIDRMWTFIFLANLIIYLILRYLKKNTKLLFVEGR